MTDSLTAPCLSAPQPVAVQEAVALIQAVCQSLNTALLYGVQHKVAQASLDRSYPAIADFIARHGPTHVGIMDGELLINGTSASGAPLAGNLTARLAARNLLSFVMAPGLSPEEYRTFLTVLLTPPAPADAGQPASNVMENLGLLHIETQNVSYRRVVEGEAAPAPSTAADTGTPDDSVTLPSDLSNVMALLKGDPTASSDRDREDLRQLANDAEKLAELILRTVTVREQTVDLASGESLTDLVVGCINRVTNTLTQGPASKTQKGRKQVKRSLLLLEGQLLNQLHALAGAPLDSEAISAAFAEATEDLDVETLTAKYMKARRAAEKAEARLKKMIDRAADDPLQENELRDRLLEQGLTPEGWETLSITREPATASVTTSAPDLNETSTLTLLLSQLTETLARSATSASETGDAQILALISEAGDQIQTLAASTEKKIDTLRDRTALSSEEAGVGKSETLSRKNLLKMLAEIAQELSQPLTIVNATLEMLRGQRSGPITAAQGELLALAAESGAQLGHLIACLMKVAGTPTSLHPDHDMLQELYRAGGAPSAT
jgi:hypothetical protein